MVEKIKDTCIRIRSEMNEWIGSIQKVCWKTGKQMAKLLGVHTV